MEVAFSILGSIASLVGLFLPAQGWKQRAIHVVYGFAVIVLAYFVATSQIQLSRVASIERAADHLVSDFGRSYTHSGFVQASLAFLEKNKDLYPDTYSRAVEMCAQFKCNKPRESGNADIVDLSYSMKGVLTGLSTIDSES